MNAFSSVITFIKQKRKILASLFLTIGILSALVDGFILISRPQTYRSKAATPEIVFKNAQGEVLPINQDGLSLSASSEVVIELNPAKLPQSYKFAENPTDLDSSQPQPYQDPPIKFDYKFQNEQNNTGTIFVEFVFADGQAQRVTSSVLTDQLPESIENLVGFTSPKGVYTLTYDKRYWKKGNFGRRVVFNLNAQYGAARIDIIEGESEKDLNSLADEIIKSLSSTPIKTENILFKEKPALLLTFKEEVIGQPIFFEQQIIKSDKKYVVIEKRAPTIGYDQNYLNNLLDSFAFTGSATEQVKGISAFSADLTTVELVDLVRPSIANIVYLYCLQITNDPKQSFLSQPKYQFCSASKGSGFVINEQGVVATNGHVAKVFPEEGLVTNLLNQGNRSFTSDLIRGVYLAKGQDPNASQIEQIYQDLNFNPQYLDRFLSEIFDLINKKIVFVSASLEKYYVNVGKDPVEVDYQKINQGDVQGAIIPSSTTFEAKLLDFNYPNKYSYEAIVNKNYKRGADVALLKIDKTDAVFPSLELGSIDNLKEGSDVIIVGYPTLVEGDKDPKAALSYKTSTKPTITKGIVSAIKKDLTDTSVVQTDASIDHGNSGGPAFNSQGQVIGIATFMTESKTGNFNFLRDVAELKGLMEKNQVENKLGDVSKVWRSGLDNFNEHYYKKAKADFEKVKTLSNSHPTVDEFIKKSDEAISKGESLEGLASLIKGRYANTMLAVFGASAVISFMLAGFLTILPLFAKKETNTPYI